MPRDSGGIYSLPAGYLAVTGETIQPSQHNPPLEDIASALTGSVPRNGSAPMTGDLDMGGNKITDLADGENPGEAATFDQIDDLQDQIDTISTGVLPPGVMVDYGGASAPSGWLLCDGSAVSRATYSDLFTAIGETWGAGDGSTTFNVPNLKGRLTVGKDDMGGSAANRVTSAGSGIDGTTLGASGGAQNVTIAQANLPNVNLTAASNGAHTHTVGFDTVPKTSSGSQVLQGSAGTDYVATTSSNGAHTHTVPLGGSGTALNKMPPVAVTNKIIKT